MDPPPPPRIPAYRHATAILSYPADKGGGTYSLGWGGKDKKGTIMSKRAVTVHMQIISLMNEASL